MTITIQDRTRQLSTMDRAFTQAVNLTQGALVHAGVLFRRRRMKAKMLSRRANVSSLDQQLNDLNLDPKRLWWGPLTLNPIKASFLLSELTADPPKRVLEAGSGTSTALLARLGAHMGFTVLSLENHLDTIAYLEYVLEGTSCRNLLIQRCGFKSARHPDGKRYRWYNADLGAQKTGVFDVVVIDGPMGTMVGRGGALPEIAPHLAIDHRIFLDDSQRPHELRCIEEWKRRFPGLEVRRPIASGGMAVIKVPGRFLGRTGSLVE